MATKAHAVEGQVINPSEGLDVCIWKLMSDRKRRTATEIGVELANFGCNRTEAKDRAVALMRRGWFKRTEQNQVTYYTLKKDITMPSTESNKLSQSTASQPSVAEAVRLVRQFVSAAEENGIMLSWKYTIDLFFSCFFDTKELTHKGMNKEELLDAAALASQMLSLPVARNDIAIYLSALDKDQEAVVTVVDEKVHVIFQRKFFDRASEIVAGIYRREDPQVAVPDTTAARVAQHPVKGEGVSTSIWKVMSDGKEYTAREVAELLETVGINQNTTIYRVNELVKRGWFCTTEKKVKGRKVKAYTLCDNIPMPENEAPYQPNVVTQLTMDKGKETDSTLGAVQQRRQFESRPSARPGWEPSPPPTEDANIKVEVDNSERPTFSSMTGSLGSHGAKVDPSYTPDVQSVGEIKPEDLIPPPILEFSIKIGGKDMTMGEVMAVVDSLRRHGYHNPAVVTGKDASFIESRMIIKGEEYTEEELRHLYQELERNGFANLAPFDHPYLATRWSNK